MQAGCEIKFRGKCIADGELNGKWAYGDLLQKNGKTFIAPHANSVSVSGHIGKMLIMHEVTPESVGQFTGLRDKNGNEIYEGDAVLLKDCGDIFDHIVKWIPEEARFKKEVPSIFFSCLKKRAAKKPPIYIGKLIARTSNNC
ncbi:YopX family protein [Brevibacillus nitrificans]|uniref:YopX family protein n=1 Tax=Brevibacillus nitrificans TaxID=651560 RepID=UPI00286205D5|nr:YopX family protein [Brevibacillus nitrificans]MDR7316604.1 hypothetical protein [Brevibacillus nitrificans]